MVNSTLRSLYPWQKDKVPNTQEVRRAAGPVRTGEENLAPTGIRSPDRLDHREALYRLSYPGTRYSMTTTNMYVKLIHMIIVFFRIIVFCVVLVIVLCYCLYAVL